MRVGFARDMPSVQSVLITCTGKQLAITLWVTDFSVYRRWLCLINYRVQFHTFFAVANNLIWQHEILFAQRLTVLFYQLSDRWNTSCIIVLRMFFVSQSMCYKATSDVISKANSVIQDQFSVCRSLSAYTKCEVYISNQGTIFFTLMFSIRYPKLSFVTFQYSGESRFKISLSNCQKEWYTFLVKIKLSLIEESWLLT